MHISISNIRIGGRSGGIPATTLRDRAGNIINDRSGAAINTRV